MASLRLPASASGRALTLGSPVLLIGIGGYGVVRGGLDAPGLWVLVAGLVILAAACWTMPWHTEIDADGVHCRTLVRRRTVSWDDVVAFERVRRGRAPGVGSRDMRGAPSHASSGGRGGPLALRTTAGERILLSDAVEPPPTWDALRELAARYAPGTSVADPPPLHPFNR